MTRHRLYYEEPHYVRECLRSSRVTAKQIHELKRALVEQLEVIDRKRLYVRLGFKSLRSYCNLGLKFTRRQSQSLESAVREYRIAVKIG
ncbi:MAG: hypothetical protein A2Z20_06160 [Bdellovibrionales bacterium RBG_16_40_8]|nr:MAG: hypothetical protein A2Z20_06160 [Bdellovibrionales bacterium RBG_16_40_8]